MHPHALRALEDLLRRVLRSPDHGIDPSAVALATRGRVARLRLRREVLLLVLLAAVSALVMLGWFLAEWGPHR